MKANELRIGNLIETKGLFKNSIVTVRTLNQGHVNDFHSDFIQPIPLTEERILELGFDNSLVSDIFLGIGCSVIRDHDVFIFRCNGCSIHVAHAHTLQNLYFALTGEELTIKP